MNDRLLFRTGIVALALTIAGSWFAMHRELLSPREALSAVGLALAVAGALEAERRGAIPAHKLRPSGVMAFVSVVVIVVLCAWSSAGADGSIFSTVLVVAIPTVLVGSALYIGSAKPRQ